MYRVFLLLGSNLGDRYGNLKEASRQVDQLAGPIVRKSSIYKTAAWGKTDQPDFYNQVLEILTRLSPETLLKTLLEVEAALGRMRGEKWAARVIDIDILLYSDLIIESDRLTIPHPRMTSRRFALEPLAEIAGTMIHPGLGKTIDALLTECDDRLPVTRLSDHEQYH